MSVRRAVAFASLGKYLGKAVNLGMMVILGRLMGPKEYGVAVLGISIFMILDAIRELASANYLVQQPELTQDKINSAFTVSLWITVGLTLIVLMLARPIASLYGEARLESYIHVVAAAFATGPLMQPIYAMWSRGLAFSIIAFMDVLGSIVNAVTSITLVWLGFGYMALAWGTLSASAIGILVAMWLSRDLIRSLRLSFREWRSVVAFGLYGSATAIIYRLSDALALMIIGRVLNTQSVGLLQRAAVISGFPNSVILSGVGAVALPAFSQQARSGGDLKRAYLSAITLVSGIQWAALALFGTMATPLTRLALGPLWDETAVLVQILCVGLLFSFPATINFPVLVAVGAIRQTLPTAAVQVVLSLAIMVWVMPMGVHAVALSTWITLPLGFVLWMRLVRAHVPFAIGELLAAVIPSFLVLAGSALGPTVVLLMNGGNPSLLDAVLAAALWAIGGMSAVVLTRHPLLGELMRAKRSLLRRWSQATGSAAT